MSKAFLLAVGGLTVAVFTTKANAYQGEDMINRKFVGDPAAVLLPRDTATVAPAVLYNPRHPDLLEHVHNLRASNVLAADPIMAEAA
jgi:hypothetical protein